MNEVDRPAFTSLLSSISSIYDRKIDDTAVPLWWRLFADHSLDLVSAALIAHTKDPDRGRFMPKPADVLAQIEIISPDGRPGADEAWAMLPADETQSCVWTAEMAQAWGLAAEVLPDRVAARMAFRDAYERLCQQAKMRNDPIVWTPSLGTGKDGREVAIREAERLGRLSLSEDQRQVYLPPPVQSVDETLRRLTSNQPADAGKRSEAKEAIAGLRALLKGEHQEQVQ